MSLSFSARQPRNILILSIEYTPKNNGGMGTQVFELARGIGRSGGHATVMTYTSGKPEITQDQGVTVHLVPATRPVLGGQQAVVQGILSYNKDVIAYVRKLLTETQQIPDVINSHNWYTFPAAKTLAEEWNIPVVSTIHGMAEPIMRWWGRQPDEQTIQQEAMMFLESDAIIAVSDSLRSIIAATYAIPEHRLYTVHNGLDYQAFVKERPHSVAKLQKLRQQLAPHNEKIILFAGRLNPQKGIDALFESAAQVIAAYPAVRYIIAGEADLQDYVAVVQELVARNPQVQEKVLLLGRIPREQLVHLYQVANLALVPSIYEPFGYAAIEAMACGVPVIASDSGGLSEIIRHGKTGLLVPVMVSEDGQRRVDREALAAAQIQLLSDDAYAQQLGNAGRDAVRSTFHLEAMVQRSLEIYAQAIVNTPMTSRTGQARGVVHE